MIYRDGSTLQGRQAGNSTTLRLISYCIPKQNYSEVSLLFLDCRYKNMFNSPTQPIFLFLDHRHKPIFQTDKTGLSGQNTKYHAVTTHIRSVVFLAYTQ